MPNWCFTEIKINAEKELIDKFEEKLNYIIQNPTIDTAFGQTWLGHIAIALGHDYNDVNCRGEIIMNERVGDDTYVLHTETAWDPMLETIVMLTNSIDKNKFDITYASTEPNIDMFLTNDDTLLNGYYISEYMYDLPEKFEIFMDESFISKQDIEKFGQTYYNTTDITIIEEKLNDELSKYDEDFYIHFYEYEYADLSEVL